MTTRAAAERDLCLLKDRTVLSDTSIPDTIVINQGRPAKSTLGHREEIFLRMDADVAAWYRALSADWQTRMNAAPKAYRDVKVRDCLIELPIV